MYNNIRVVYSRKISISKCMDLELNQCVLPDVHAYLSNVCGILQVIHTLGGFESDFTISVRTQTGFYGYVGVEQSQLEKRIDH